MDIWECKCGHEVAATSNPTPVKWDDGHICVLRIRKEPEPCWLCKVTYTLYESELCQDCYFWAENEVANNMIAQDADEATFKAWYAVEQMRVELGIHGPNGSVYDCDGLPWDKGKIIGVVHDEVIFEEESNA